MKRVWVKNPELGRLKELFRQELGTNLNSVYILFDRVLPLLEKPEITRIIWCRAARNEFSRWGLRVGIRNSKGAYKVEVVDPQKWKETISGVSFDESDAPPPTVQPVEHPELVPRSDPDYVMPDWAGHLLDSILTGETVMLVGATGSGKSSIARELCARSRKPFIRVNLNGETSVSDIIGGWRVQGREMCFNYGPIPQAMRLGAVLCLDEIDAAIPQVLFALQPLLEDGGTLLISDTGERIIPHPEFRVVATANTLGKGDETGLYAGTNVLNESFLDRFHSVFHVDYLPAEQEAYLLTSKVKGLGLNVAERMVRVAHDLRQALSDGLIYSTFSTRKLLAWGRKTVQLGCPKQAAVYTILNKISADDRRVVSEVLQRHGF